MTKIRNYVMAGALALATALPAGVQAAPMSVPLKLEKSSDVTNVRCHRWGCRRGWRGRYWGPRRVWIAPRVVIRPAPRYVVRSGYNAHVRWCLNRYGSYNPATNTFLAYDGYYKRCRSPYR
jgi:hypothetical protein